MADRRLPSEPERVTRAPDVSSAELDDLRALVTLSRTRRSDCGQRQVIVQLDGGPKTQLYFGDSVTLEVQPGAHHCAQHALLEERAIHNRAGRTSRFSDQQRVALVDVWHGGGAGIGAAVSPRGAAKSI
jgi:hypothetical protein